MYGFSLWDNKNNGLYWLSENYFQDAVELINLHCAAAYIVMRTVCLFHVAMWLVLIK